MEGFFTKKETESVTRPDGKLYSCVSCGLYKDCKNPKLSVSGGFKKGILNIGSYPSSIEDRRGEPFQNKASKLLEKVYAELGIDLYEDCLNTYAVKCSTNTPPTAFQLESCRKYILKVIDKYKPKVIVLFGDLPLYSVIGNRWKKDLGKIEKWRGWQIPDQDFQAWILPVFDPDYVLAAKSMVEQVIWKQDLEHVLRLTKVDLLKYPEPEIIYLQDDLSILDSIKVGNIAFDYETTGLKPYAEGHKIICASVAVSENKVYTFKIPESRKAQQPFKELLKRKLVGKIAHNMKFEDTWSFVKLRTQVENWVYDTMQATHIIDNRPNISSLKFQAYVQLGVVDYDSNINNFLTGEDSKNCNSLNTIEKLISTQEGENELLKYCALDSLFEYRLANLFKKPMLGTQGKTLISPPQSDFPNAYTLFHDGILSFARTERQGICVDVPLIEKQMKRLGNKITNVETEFYESDFYDDWRKHSKGIPSINSTDQLSDYLYNVKKLTPMKRTKGGAGSTDIDSLKFLDIPALNLLLKRSGYMKLKNTFLDGILREQVDGVLHPYFHLHLAQTYRSSSSNPNFQNFPKRDDFQMQIIRSSIKASPGNQLLEMDFSGIEVGISCTYHKDPTMIKYVSDPASDMHGDMAEQIFLIKKLNKQLKSHKLLRGCAKNGFVFPQFYGDYYKNNAESICRDWVKLPLGKWKKTDGILMDNGITIGEHLILNKITSYNKFIDHLKAIEDDFWGVRFKVYNKWKDKQWAEYPKDGIPLKTGFVCKGVMDKKNVTNYPIQGSAFHCLLWTFIEVEKELINRGAKSKLIGQIHDAVVLDVDPLELEDVYKLITKIATIDLPKTFQWINVPLSIEAELCPVDGSWADKEEFYPDSAYQFNDDIPF